MKVFGVYLWCCLQCMCQNDILASSFEYHFLFIKLNSWAGCTKNSKSIFFHHDLVKINTKLFNLKKIRLNL